MRSGQKRMRETAAPLILARDSDPNLEFFARANPGHAEGDMLVCLCPLSLSQLAAASPGTPSGVCAGAAIH